ncbi:MAG: histidinol dehydrogenase, partial [Clostridia bacterium]|nr:histidinol dehydrogenase [Clostridia bacterium]
MIKILDVNAVSAEEIFARTQTETDVSGIVSDIIATVRREGDAALKAYAKKFDGAELKSLLVTPEELDEAVASVSPKFIEILKTAAENIRRFHERQVRTSFILNDRDGIVTGQKVIPMDRVGLYVPGGTAAYPSTVLMDAIPAKIAGCPELVMTTPPNKEGKINPVILAAAKIAGV